MTLIELLFPKKFTCLACKKEIKEGDILCDECRKDFVMIKSDRACKRCGQEIFGEGDYCMDCKNKDVEFERNYAVFAYKGGVRRIIHRLKFGGGKYLVDFLGECLERKYKDIEEEIDLITFVPMTKKDLRKRGYNQSKLLAEYLSKKTGIDVVDVIEKRKQTKQQVGLNFKKRRENLRGCFAPTAKLIGKTVLVVDDVCTTGATLSEIARVLKKAGAKRVITLTLAVNVMQMVKP